jgi:hypothetical protein
MKDLEFNYAKNILKFLWNKYLNVLPDNNNTWEDWIKGKNTEELVFLIENIYKYKKGV